VRRVIGSLQLLAGGVLHVTPAQGSFLQAPLSQPNAQVVLPGAYEQLPAEHVPLWA
jgi:hypothetical protein